MPRVLICSNCGDSVIAFSERTKCKCGSRVFQNSPTTKKITEKLVNKKIQIVENLGVVSKIQIDYLQLLKIEIAKAIVVEHDIIRAIFEDGLKRNIKPFTILKIRDTFNTDKKQVLCFQPVESKNKVSKYLLFNQGSGVKFPSFISYSNSIFRKGGEEFRFVDIDTKEISKYHNSNEFTRILNLIEKANLSNRLIPFCEVVKLYYLIQEISDSIKSHLNYDRIYFTGAGFRPLLRGGDIDRIPELIKEGLLCNSSSKGHQPMKIFSPQVRKPHLQSDVNPYIEFEDFRLTNPCFFIIKQDIAYICQNYYGSWLKSHYPGKYDENITDMEVFNEMESRQMKLEIELGNFF